MIFRPIFFVTISLSLLTIVFVEELLAQEKKFIRTGASPVIYCDPEKMDFGEVLSGEFPSMKLRIMNKGKGELALLKVGFTCGCAIPKIVMPSGEIVVPDKKGKTKIGVLGPEESAELQLVFKTAGLRGEIKRTLTVYSNDPKTQTYMVPILADVKTAFALEPRQVNFGSVRKCHSLTRILVIRSVLAGAFKITGVKSIPSYYEYEVAHFHEGDTPCAKLTLTLTEKAPIGPQNFRFKFDMESDKIRDIEIPVYGMVLPAVTFETGSQSPRDIINFGILEMGKGAVTEIDIINDNPQVPYRILEMKINGAYSDFIETELITVEKGIRYKVKVTIKPELNARFFRGEILFLSDHPDLKKKVLSIKGWIKKVKGIQRGVLDHRSFSAENRRFTSVPCA